MKTTNFPVKTYANYAMILIASFALSYSLVTYFVFGKAIPSLLAIAAAIVFANSMWTASNLKNTPQEF